MVTLSEIENWRKLNKLTKKELAEKLNVSYPFLVDMLNGKREISGATAAKFEVLKNEAVRVSSYDDVRAFAVRMTNEEYQRLCQHAKVENMDAEQAENVIRKLLQETFDHDAALLADVLEEQQPEAREPLHIEAGILPGQLPRVAGRAE